MGKDLFELADYAIKKGMRVSMSPSATVEVTKERMDKAKEVGISRWSFSIDGADAKTHDAFRGIEGTFDLTIEKIKYLMKSVFLTKSILALTKQTYTNLSKWRN